MCDMGRTHVKAIREGGGGDEQYPCMLTLRRTKRGCESLFANLPTQVGWAVSSEAKQMKAMFETVPKLHLILRNFTSTSVVSAVLVPLHLDSMGLCE